MFLKIVLAEEIYVSKDCVGGGNFVALSAPRLAQLGTRRDILMVQNSPHEQLRACRYGN